MNEIQIEMEENCKGGLTLKCIYETFLAFPGQSDTGSPFLSH